MFIAASNALVCRERPPSLAIDRPRPMRILDSATSSCCARWRQILGWCIQQQQQRQLGAVAEIHRSLFSNFSTKRTHASHCGSGHALESHSRGTKWICCAFCAQVCLEAHSQITYARGSSTFSHSLSSLPSFCNIHPSTGHARASQNRMENNISMLFRGQVET